MFILNQVIADSKMRVLAEGNLKAAANFKRQIWIQNLGHRAVQVLKGGHSMRGEVVPKGG